MRLLVLTHNYPRFPGDPAGAFVARLARAAVERGATVRVLAPHAPGTEETERADGLEVTRFRYAPEALEAVAYTGDLHRRALTAPRMALVLPAFLLRFAAGVRHATDTFQPDVVHAHWWLPAGWFASRAGHPYVLTCHGTDVRLLERGSLWRRAAHSVFERAGAVTAVSRFLARDIERLLGLAPERVRALPMPVDLDLFAQGTAIPKATPPRILYAGNLVPSKGVDVLIEAVALLHRRSVVCRLRVLGEGPDEPRLRRAAAALGVAPVVEWCPFVPQTEMPREYGASTVTVLPTRGQAEGLGLALVEALAAGAAVVGSRAGGIPEVVEHERTGLLFDDGDAAGLAAALERLLVDDALRRQLVGAGATRVRERHSPVASAERFWELYRALVRRQPRS